MQRKIIIDEAGVLMITPQVWTIIAFGPPREI